MKSPEQPNYIIIRYDIPPPARNESQVRHMLAQLDVGGYFDYKTDDSSNFYQQAKRLGMKLRVKNFKMEGFFRIWRVK